jgi:hypothetical protein
MFILPYIYRIILAFVILQMLGCNNYPTNSIVEGENSAEIHFTIALPMHLRITVENSFNREVQLVADRTFEGGSHNLVIEYTDHSGQPLPKGLYFVYFNNGSNTAPQTQRFFVE